MFNATATILAAFISFLISAGFLTRCTTASRFGRVELGVLAVVIVAFLLRSNVSIIIYGGQDPGVYTNVASEFVHHGSWIIKDRLLDEFAGRPDLRDYYIAKSFRSAARDEDGNWYGNMLPGIYLKNLDANEWVAQFYHVNTVWLAIGQWIFGREWQGLTLAFLSSLIPVAAYIIATRISNAPVVGLSTAALLATNAAHSYVGTSPVSEAVAGFFFLSALAMLIARCQLTSVVPFAALFLTRITGFITAPVILVSLAWIVAKRRDVKAAWAGIGVLGAYASSVLWGLHFSAPYSKSIYRGKLGIPHWALDYAFYVFLALAVAWCVFCFGALRYRTGVGLVCKFLLRYRSHVTIVILSVAITIIAVRGYLLAFTDYYSANRWLAVRWNIAARGVESLRYLTINSLSLMLSPLGLVAFLVGLGYVGRLAFQRSVLAPVATCSLGFFVALTCKQLTTPYLYYFGRYLVSELLPLAIVCGVLVVYAIVKRYHRGSPVFLFGYCISIFALLYPSLAARMQLREGRQFFEAMSCIAQATPGRSILLVDKKDFPEIPVVTALRFAFQKSTFSISDKDASQPGYLTDLISFFSTKGYSVYLLSSRDVWQSQSGFTKLFRISAVMRTLGGKGQAPTKVNTLGLPLRLYALGVQSDLPEICRKVQGAA